MGAETWLITLVVAGIYLGVIRLLDMNESEPLWAVGMLFGLGALCAVIVSVAVSSTTMELSVVVPAFAKEGARLIAIGGGLGVLASIGKRRGWSDVNGLADGIVYGASGGLGFAVGIVIVRDMFTVVVLPGEPPALLTSLTRVALAGLADGVFGAIIGVGVVGAIEARSAVAKIGLVVVGYVGAVAAHAGHDVLSHGNALGGTEGFIRAWVGLLLPLLLVAIVGAVALVGERRSIRDQLESEAQHTTVTPEELSVLLSLPKRQMLYMKTLTSGGIGAWTRVRELHNRQVQLALAKARSDETAVASLRNVVLDLKRAGVA